jgi:hypothetical protein
VSNLPQAVDLFHSICVYALTIDISTFMFLTYCILEGISTIRYENKLVLVYNLAIVYTIFHNDHSVKVTTLGIL